MCSALEALRAIEHSCARPTCGSIEASLAAACLVRTIDDVMTDTAIPQRIQSRIHEAERRLALRKPFIVDQREDCCPHLFDRMFGGAFDRAFDGAFDGTIGRSKPAQRRMCQRPRSPRSLA